MLYKLNCWEINKTINKISEVALLDTLSSCSFSLMIYRMYLKIPENREWRERENATKVRLGYINDTLRYSVSLSKYRFSPIMDREESRYRVRERE